MRDWNAIVRARLAALGGRPPDDGLVEEFAAHLAQVYEDARASGLDEETARGRALELLERGDLWRRTIEARRPTVTQQIVIWSRQEPPPPAREGFMSLSTLTRDARHAVRVLVRSPMFSLIAVLTFAVGIGVNTAVFNVVNSVLLRPLPYPEYDRITLLWMDNRREGIKEDITSWPTYVDWRDQNTTYEHMAGFRPTAFSLTGAGEPERLQGAMVTANFFDVMKVQPLMGRLFTPDHETPGRDAVVLLSHGLWQRRFGGVNDVLGRTIGLGGRQYEIIGVMPPALRWPDKAEVWTPLAPNEQTRQARGGFWLPVIGRMKPGISPGQAQTEMSQIGDRLEKQYPSNAGFGVNVVPLERQMVGHIQRPLLILLGAVGFVLLIACANLANLMLGRTAARRKELAIRTALGAGRGRLIRQIVTETAVLALAGGALGVLLAWWATQFFVSLGGDTIPRGEAITIDMRVLLFALVLSMASALVAGVIPALQASRPRVVDHLREGAREGAGGASRRTRGILVATEVALAVILLTGAGLLIRTLWTMQQMERGFRPEHVAMMTVSPPGSTYPGPPEVRQFWSRLLERVRALPGVTAAATGTALLQPLVTNSGVFAIEGKPPVPPNERVEYPTESVSPEYFETVGMTLASGRNFNDLDVPESTPVVVINETFARTGWPGQDPLGRRIKPGSNPNSETPWLTVVGVIRDAHRAAVTRPIRPEIYFATSQRTPRTQTVFIRTAGDPDAIVSAVRRELQAIDPQLPLFAVTTAERAIAETLTQPRFQAVLLTVFAGIALLLATIGIYGVTSNAVSQRTQEVGIRMAMGAGRLDVLWLILRQHLRPAIAGLATGIAGALLLGRFLQSLLFGVGATDPATFAMVSIVLLVVAVAACLIPARRVTRVDPLVALRSE